MARNIGTATTAAASCYVLNTTHFNYRGRTATAASSGSRAVSPTNTMGAALSPANSTVSGACTLTIGPAVDRIVASKGARPSSTPRGNSY